MLSDREAFEKEWKSVSTFINNWSIPVCHQEIKYVGLLRAIKSTLGNATPNWQRAKRKTSLVEAVKRPIGNWASLYDELKAHFDEKTHNLEIFWAGKKSRPIHGRLD